MLCSTSCGTSTRLSHHQWSIARGRSFLERLAKTATVSSADTEVLLTKPTLVFVRDGKKNLRPRGSDQTRSFVHRAGSELSQGAHQRPRRKTPAGSCRLVRSSVQSFWRTSHRRCSRELEGLTPWASAIRRDSSRTGDVVQCGLTPSSTSSSRIRVRARWSSTRWLALDSPRSASASTAVQPRMSRMVTISR